MNESDREPTVITLPDDLPDDVVDRAYLCAAHLHRKQCRKGHGFPYLAHLMAVASIVWEHGGTSDQVAAALLHDAAEDHGGQPVLDALAEEFDVEVVEIVRLCSDALTPRGEEKALWIDRKRDYLAKLSTKPADALLVSAADKLHNARSMVADYRLRREELWGPFTMGRPYQLWYYGELARTLAAVLPGPLTDELQRTVEELHALVAERMPGVDLEIAEVRRELEAQR